MIIIIAFCKDKGLREFVKRRIRYFAYLVNIAIMIIKIHDYDVYMVAMRYR